MSHGKFAALTVRIWRAQARYKKALAYYNEHPTYACRVQRVNRAAQRLNKAVLTLAAATLVNFG
jgi:hypothetical protein